MWGPRHWRQRYRRQQKALATRFPIPGAQPNFALASATSIPLLLTSLVHLPPVPLCFLRPGPLGFRWLNHPALSLRGTMVLLRCVPPFCLGKPFPLAALSAPISRHWTSLGCCVCDDPLTVTLRIRGPVVPVKFESRRVVTLAVDMEIGLVNVFTGLYRGRVSRSSLDSSHLEKVFANVRGHFFRRGIGIRDFPSLPENQGYGTLANSPVADVGWHPTGGGVSSSESRLASHEYSLTTVTWRSSLFIPSIFSLR